MSIELFSDKGELGQFASNGGYSDLIAASQKDSVLKKFFDDANTEDTSKVASALKSLKSSDDVEQTAKTLAGLMEDQDLVYISNGTYDKDDEDVEKEDDGDWVTINGNRVLIGADGKPKAGNPKAYGGLDRGGFDRSTKLMRTATMAIIRAREYQKSKNFKETQRAYMEAYTASISAYKRNQAPRDALEILSKENGFNLERYYKDADSKPSKEDIQESQKYDVEAKSWADKLTEGQVEACEVYSSTEGANGILDALRGKPSDPEGGSRSGDEIDNYKNAYDNAKSYSKQIDAAIQKGKLSEDTVLYRGTDASGLKVGQTVTENGYMSTSRDSTVAEDFVGTSGRASAKAAIMIVSAPKNSKVGFLSAVSAVPEESEILFPRGTKYKVDKIDRAHDGAYTVHVKILK